MSHQFPVDLIAVGHIALDFITAEHVEKPNWTLGGSSAFVSLAANMLGASVRIISKVGGDVDEKMLSPLLKPGIDLRGLGKENAPTTRFRINYRGEKRRLRLERICKPLTIEDVDIGVCGKALHICPIADEVSEKLAIKLIELGELTSLDPQGLLRRPDRRGNINLRRWLHREVLRKIHVFKSSSDELKAATGKSDVKAALKLVAKFGPKILIATMGSRGNLMLLPNRCSCLIPTCKPKIFLDPTGAGDVFIGSFIVEYLKSGDPLWSVAVGSAAASFVVEGVGCSRLGTRKEILERAELAYNRIKIDA